MKVLIVAKTRQGSGACVGGITLDGRSVRLIAADAEFNERAGPGVPGGEVWEVDASAAESLTPPHVENIVVPRQTPVGADDRPRALHRSSTCAGCRRHGTAFTRGCSNHPMAAHSTLTRPAACLPAARCSGGLTNPWRAVEEGKRIRYRYPGGIRRANPGLRRVPGAARDHPRGHAAACIVGSLVASRRAHRRRAALLRAALGLVPFCS